MPQMWLHQPSIGYDAWSVEISPIELRLIDYARHDGARGWIGFCDRLDLKVDLGAIPVDDAKLLIVEMVCNRLRRVLADLEG